MFCANCLGCFATLGVCLFSVETFLCILHRIPCYLPMYSLVFEKMYVDARECIPWNQIFSGVYADYVFRVL